MGIVILLAAFGYAVYRYMEEVDAKEAVQAELKSTKDQLAFTESELSNANQDRAQLSQKLNEEKERNDSFFRQIEELSDTVGILDKLSKTDSELLQKYSKVFFLNEHYIPERLVKIDERYSFQEKELQIHSRVWPFLRRMLRDAQNDGMDLQITSAYRSFGDQTAIKSGYVFVYGSGANAFSADQGYSEHQLGTAVDFVTAGNPSLTISFENTAAFKWLEQNAHKYGFTLSYPRGNAYYQYEPWHWRFVGENLAKDLYREGKYFYDLDQRKINEYLVEIFD